MLPMHCSERASHVDQCRVRHFINQSEFQLTPPLDHFRRYVVSHGSMNQQLSRDDDDDDDDDYDDDDDDDNEDGNDDDDDDGSDLMMERLKAARSAAEESPLFYE